MNHKVLNANGIELHRLTYNDIEQVRLWRNSEEVRRWMAFREEISSESQKRWFESLEPTRQYYYLIVYDGNRVGLVNLKNLDVTAGSAEGGIFIADPKYQNGMVAFQAILTMYDFGFETLKLNEITAHILAENKRAIRFNQTLGFQLANNQDGITNQLWRVMPDSYYKHTKVLRKFFDNPKN